MRESWLEILVASLSLFLSLAQPDQIIILYTHDRSIVCVCVSVCLFGLVFFVPLFLRFRFWLVYFFSSLLVLHLAFGWLVGSPLPFSTRWLLVVGWKFGTVSPMVKVVRKNELCSRPHVVNKVHRLYCMEKIRADLYFLESKKNEKVKSFLALNRARERSAFFDTEDWQQFFYDTEGSAARLFNTKPRSITPGLSLCVCVCVC